MLHTHYAHMRIQGEEGAGGLLDLIDGTANPSAHLTQAWSISIFRISFCLFSSSYRFSFRSRSLSLYDSVVVVVVVVVAVVVVAVVVVVVFLFPTLKMTGLSFTI